MTTTSYNLKKLHSYIKNDDIDAYKSLLKTYPNLINFKNHRNENLLFYSLFCNSLKISSFIISEKKSLVIEKNNSGKNCIQALLAKNPEQSPIFLTQFLDLLDQSFLTKLFSNQDNKGNNLFMSLLFSNYQDLFLKYLKLLKNEKIILEQTNFNNDSIVHFLTMHYKNDISPFLEIFSHDSFFKNNKIKTTPLMYASHNQPYNNYLKLFNFLFSKKSPHETAQVLNTNNSLNLNCINISLLNNDSKVYSLLNKYNISHTKKLNSSLFLSFNLLKNENFLDYYNKNKNNFSNTELFSNILKNNHHILLKKIHKSDNLFISKVTQSIFYDKSYKDSINLISWKNLLPEHLSNVFVNKNNSGFEKFIFIIKKILQKPNSQISLIKELINNSTIYKNIFKLDNYEAFILQQIFYCSKSNIHSLINSEDIQNFSNNFKLNAILNFISILRDITISNKLENNHDFKIPLLLNEQLRFQLDINKEDLLNSVLNEPTYNYWELLSKKHDTLVKNFYYHDIFLEGIQNSYNSNSWKNFLDNPNLFSKFLFFSGSNNSLLYKNLIPNKEALFSITNVFKESIKTCEKNPRNIFFQCYYFINLILENKNNFTKNNSLNCILDILTYQEEFLQQNNVQHYQINSALAFNNFDYFYNSNSEYEKCLQINQFLQKYGVSRFIKNKKNFNSKIEEELVHSYLKNTILNTGFSSLLESVNLNLQIKNPVDFNTINNLYSENYIPSFLNIIMGTTNQIFEKKHFNYIFDFLNNNSEQYLLDKIYLKENPQHLLLDQYENKTLKLLHNIITEDYIFEKINNLKFTNSKDVNLFIILYHFSNLYNLGIDWNKFEKFNQNLDITNIQHVIYIHKEKINLYDKNISEYWNKYVYDINDKSWFISSENTLIKIFLSDLYSSKLIDNPHFQNYLNLIFSTQKVSPIFNLEDINEYYQYTDYLICSNIFKNIKHPYVQQLPTHFNINDSFFNLLENKIILDSQNSNKKQSTKIKF